MEMAEGNVNLSECKVMVKDVQKPSRKPKCTEQELEECDTCNKKTHGATENFKCSTKRKSIDHALDENTRYVKKSKVTKCDNIDSVLISKSSVTLTKAEKNRLYYEKNKDKIKEARKKRYQNSVKGYKSKVDYCEPAHGTENDKDNSVVISKSSVTLTKSDKNRLYYEQNKNRIKEARTKRYQDSVKGYENKVKHKVELSKKQAEYGEDQNIRTESGNESDVASKDTAKLTRAEINRRFYEKNKARIKEARKKKYEDPVNHVAELARSRASYATLEKRTAKLTAKKKAYRDPGNHAAQLTRAKAAYAVPKKRTAKLEAKKKAYKDPVMHAAELAKRKKAYDVPEKRTAKLAAQKKFRQNPVNRALILGQRRILYQKQKIQRQKRINPTKRNKTSDYEYLLTQARKAMLEMPILACTVCHRARFKEQVKLCHRNKYPQSELVRKCFTGKYIHQCSGNCTDSSVHHEKKKKEWICFTCHRHLLKGNMPPQAVVNNLWLDDIPKELKTLNALEMHLVSIIQPFMKIIPLPRGGQKGVRGQMVCVPANLQRTADTLPWTLNTENLIRVKLKRKQQYKGHHLYMVVSQKKVMAALRTLMEINPAYKGKS